MALSVWCKTLPADVNEIFFSGAVKRVLDLIVGRAFTFSLNIYGLLPCVLLVLLAYSAYVVVFLILIPGLSL